jgi:hypothetical protein
LRFSSAYQWVLACCLIAAAPAYLRAQAVGGTEPDSKQKVPLEIAWDLDLTRPVGDSLSMRNAPSLENQLVTTDAPALVEPSLPEAPNPVVNNGYVPLTADQRWQNFWKDSMLSPLAYVGALGGAFGEQLAGQPRQWSNGFWGYTKRVSANVLQFGAQESIHQGGEALMHGDPRYLPCECKGGMRRTWYALKMSFLTYKDDGNKMFDFSQFAGAYGGAMIAEVRYPSHYSPLVQGVQNGDIQVGANVAINVFREFSPELSRLNPFRRHAAAQ